MDFDATMANEYDERICLRIPGYEILHAVSETVLSDELSPTASILTVGMGTGKEILDWAPKHPGWNFLGVDPSPAMLAVAQQQVQAGALSERVRLKAGTVQSLPEDECFDAATLLLVLHFVPDNGGKEELLSSIVSRLKPGAPFIMASLFGDPETTRYKRMTAFTKSWALARGMDPKKAEELFCTNRTDLHVVPEDRIKNLFRYAGFIDVQRIYQAFSIGMWVARSPRPKP